VHSAAQLQVIVSSKSLHIVNSLCQTCDEKEKASCHFLVRCPAKMLVRSSLSGSHLRQPEKQYAVRPSTVMVHECL